MNDDRQAAETDEAERLRAELEALRIQNLFLKTVFDGISEEIMVLDREFTVQDVNQVMLERYGLDKTTALGRKCFELKEACGAPCHMGGEGGCPLTRAVETESHVETTYRHVDAQGHHRELSLAMYPIVSPGDDKTQYYMEIARDETRYRTLIERHAPEFFIHGHIHRIFTNPEQRVTILGHAVPDL